jgi:anthranilate/para-aminobenzoate synthase component II
MILVVDHYDSFTYNLVQLIEGLGRATEVVRSDELPAADLVAREPEAVVLSPGPGHPKDAACPGTSPFWVYASGIRRSAS